MGLCFTTTKIQSCPVLILGTAGSGKSTFVKQMCFLHPTQTELIDFESYRSILIDNIRSGLTELIKLAEQHQFELEPSNRKFARKLLQKPSSGEEFDEGMERTVKALWEDEGIQSAWRMSIANNNLHCTHLAYLLDKTSNYRDTGYKLTKEDILRARQRTTGCTITEINDGDRCWKFTDVGGQQIEREKWLDLLSSETYVAYIFFVALDDYNVTSSERPEATRLNVSLSVFADTLKILSETADACPLVLFNKTDIFTEKLNSEIGWNDFQKIFPDYKGGRVMEEAGERIFQEFRKEVGDRRIQGYFTCALDSDIMKTIFEAIVKYVQDLAMQASGLDF